MLSMLGAHSEQWVIAVRRESTHAVAHETRPHGLTRERRSTQPFVRASELHIACVCNVHLRAMCSVAARGSAGPATCNPRPHPVTPPLRWTAHAPLSQAALLAQVCSVRIRPCAQALQVAYTCVRAGRGCASEHARTHIRVCV